MPKIFGVLCIALYYFFIGRHQNNINHLNEEKKAYKSPQKTKTNENKNESDEEEKQYKFNCVSSFGGSILAILVE
jgi:hypothetical protein